MFEMGSHILPARLELTIAKASLELLADIPDFISGVSEIEQTATSGLFFLLLRQASSLAMKTKVPVWATRRLRK